MILGQGRGCPCRCVALPMSAFLAFQSPGQGWGVEGLLGGKHRARCVDNCAILPCVVSRTSFACTCDEGLWTTEYAFFGRSASWASHTNLLLRCHCTTDLMEE